MKKIIKFIMAIAVASSAMFYSCETIELEQLDNPNGLIPEQADPDLLLNTIQVSYIGNMGFFNGNASQLTRIEYLFGRDYLNAIQPINVNGVWSSTYSTIIPDLNIIEARNAEAGDGSFNYQEGVGKVLLAHNMMLLVDFVGDVPFSQANDPDQFPDPAIDSGADVYQAALDLLDEAEILLADSVGQDLFYNTTGNGGSGPWITLINTIRMKAALTTGDLTTFASLEAEGDFINETSQDFQYRFIENDVNPDGRHPDYINAYTTAGANGYRSNWLMDQMLENDDPRIRYYFFRQTGCTPGASCNPNPTGEAVTQLQCSIQEPPAHVTGAGFGDIFCFLEDGYWGRYHGDDSGGPPDSFQRTAPGVYPAGGLLDGDFFRNGTIEENDNGTDDPSDDFFEFVLIAGDDGVNLGRGGGGAGIEPFILSSYVDFMRAEVALMNGNTMLASELIEKALQASITKVQSFGDLDIEFSPDLLDGTTFDTDTGEIIDDERASDLLPTTDDNDAFVMSIITEFNNASMEDRWNILAEQNWVTQYGGGAETYNFYRRTGFPTTIPPNIEPNPGTFVRSLPYPANEVTANPNLNQKPDQSVQVFWDTNPPSAVGGTGFPFAN